MKNLLIIKMSALGDAVMALPALAALRRRYPEAAIDWLAEPTAAGLLAGCSALNRILVWPRPALKAAAAAGRLVQAGSLFKEFVQRLRGVEYDAALDLQGLFKSGLMMGLARARRKVGFDRTREGAYLFLNEKMRPYDPERHAARRYLDAAAYLGAEEVSDLPPPKYYEPPLEAEARAAEALGGDEDFTVLNIGTKWATKRWPLEHWRALAARLAGEIRPVFTGGPEDAPLVQTLLPAAGPRAVNLCGRTKPTELAAVLARARLVVAGDTGPLHLAAAVGAEGLALFGPTRPNRTGPFGGRFEIIQPPLDCLGCLKKRCPKPCLATISPDEVWLKLSRRLAENRAPDGKDIR